MISRLLTERSPTVCVLSLPAAAAAGPKAEGEDDDADAVAEAAEDDERCCSVDPVDDGGDEALRFCCCCWLEEGGDDSVVAVARSKEARGLAFPYRGIRRRCEDGRERGRRGGGGTSDEHRPAADDDEINVEDVEADRELARLLAAAEAAEIEEERSMVLVLLLFCNLLPLRILEAAARTERIDSDAEDEKKVNARE